MITPNVLFAIAISLFVVGLLSFLVVAWLRVRRRSSSTTLEALLSRLEAVDRFGIQRVAADVAGTDDEDQGDALQGWQIAELVGGLQGIETLAANCEVLIDLACYVQQWYPEALPVAEQLRLNTREIQWHLERLRGAQSRGHLDSAFPDYAQRAVTIYHGMTQHVLVLFAMSQNAGLAQLSEVL